jgi:hypothetical protein
MLRHFIILTILFAAPAGADAAGKDNSVEQLLAGRFAALALSCVHQEYPNKISHTLNSDADVLAPRQLFPAFYGCYDWHSSVHGHWLLTRLLRFYPDASFAGPARTALEQSFRKENIEQELAYFQADGRKAFERPYGIAWYFQLMTELREWDDPDARRWQAHLQPLETQLLASTSDWLNKLAYPIRTGEHSQTAFAFGLMADWAAQADKQEFYELLKNKSMQFYAADINCPLSYEPSGQDFLSPCLAEADLMRRFMAEQNYKQWLERFLPRLPIAANAQWLPLAEVTDRSDGKLAHLDGLHLSRAWMLEGIAAALSHGSAKKSSLSAAAVVHREAGLAAVTGEHYAGGHWLGSFATYLVTRRGVDNLAP